MRQKKITLFIFFILTAVIISVILVTGKKGVDNKSYENNTNVLEITKNIEEREISFHKMGNNQGNIENGGEQTFWGDSRILVNVDLDNQSNKRMLFFNLDTQELQLACDKKACLHNESDCASNEIFRYLISYSDVYFGVSDHYTKEILKCSNSETTCYYKCKNDIYGLWGYRNYLYYMTDFGIYRISLKKKRKEEKVLDKPVLYEYLTFYEDKMFFCEEDKLLYSADLDGRNKVRICDDMAYSPQIHRGRLYYRSAEYDAKGSYEIENDLYSITLDGKNKKKIVDDVYQFNALEDAIYYTTIPDDGETTLYSVDYNGKNKKKIMDCAASYLYVFEETDWILYMKTEGELQPGEEGGKPTHLYCVKKDGSQVKRLEYPQIIEE